MKIAILILGLLFTSVMAKNNEDIILYKVLNKNHKITPETVADALRAGGYVVSKNQDMNGPYEKQFKKTIFHSYNLMSIYHPKYSTKIVPKHANSGIFTPFSIVTYQEKKNHHFYIALLSAKAQEKILKTSDTLFHKLEKNTRKTIKIAISNAQEIDLPYKAMKADGELFTKYSFDVDDKDAIEERDDMMLMIESEMKPSGFVEANYIDFNKILKKHNNNDYIFYDAYSLCKLKIIFELSKTRPEAGAFAPCTMAIYHKKGSNKTNIVTLSIANLPSTLAIKDKKILEILKKAQNTMKSIIEDATE